MALGDFGVSVSPNTVARLLHQMGYSLRVNHKKLSTDFSPDRNDQLLYLSDLRQRFQRRGLPIISVDTKKRELVGNFKNPGSRWDLSPRLVHDHDFRSDSTGVVIPYGIYDLLANRGSVMVGVSHDTSAFAAHAIAHWWRQERRSAIHAPANSSSWVTPVAAMALDAAPGKPSSSLNWPTHSV
jgi:Rhodopirellula transposase DDE domain